MSEQEGAKPVPERLRTHWRSIALVLMAALVGAVLVGIIATLGAANRSRDRAIELQRHSYEVMIQARALSGTIARAEASLGRYVISGDAALGKLYADQWRQAGSDIDWLDGVTNDNTSQQARIDILRAAYRQRGTELAQAGNATAHKDYAAAFSAFYRGRNAASLQTISTELRAIIRSERDLLTRRTAIASATIERSTRVATVLAGFGMLLVAGAIFLGWATVKALAARTVAQDDAHRERERALELQAAVAAATAELREREATLRQAQKMQAVGQLTGGIAHDFNNMLAVILGGLELAKRSASPRATATARHLDNAIEGANRAAALTQRLLAFSRDEALKPEPVIVSEVIAGMSDLLDRTLGDTIAVQIDVDSDGWTVWIDRHQLENSLLNLAVNARDAMDGRGHLTIAVATMTQQERQGNREPGDYVTLAVSDTGCGMTPEVIERAYEPFFTTKPVGKGTGLGLSQIFAFVRQSGGAIGIVSAPGEGTTVTLYLPRHGTAAISAPPGPDPSESSEQLAVATPAALDILVVEDDPRVLAATIDALEELGHRPIGCEDPTRAATVLDGMAAVDLIVSDVLMPEMTGPEMIASLGHRPELAVLFVTGYAGEGVQHELAGHAVLRKPFTLAKLERAIAEALAHDRPAPPNLIAAE